MVTSGSQVHRIFPEIETTIMVSSPILLNGSWLACQIRPNIDRGSHDSVQEDGSIDKIGIKSPWRMSHGMDWKYTLKSTTLTIVEPLAWSDLR